MKLASLVTTICLLSVTAGSHAATVTYHLTVNGTTDPVTVNQRDAVTVGIWAHVTDNTFIINGNEG